MRLLSCAQRTLFFIRGEHEIASPSETAEPLAQRLHLSLDVALSLNEIDFGAWTGLTFGELAHLAEWQRFKTFRSGTRIPGGEMMQEVQQRIVTFMLELRDRQPDDTIAIYTHGDAIRSAVAFFLGMPLDFMLRFEISPASVTSVALDRNGTWVGYVNRTVPDTVTM